MAQRRFAGARTTYVAAAELVPKGSGRRHFEGYAIACPLMMLVESADNDMGECRGRCEGGGLRVSPYDSVEFSDMFTTLLSFLLTTQSARRMTASVRARLTPRSYGRPRELMGHENQQVLLLRT